ncbi:MAG: glycosyltransferase [Patescibacteria group bacterium]
MSKKILIFSTAYQPFMSGAEMAVDEISKRINNFEFDLITARIDRQLADKEKYNNITIYRVGFGLKTLDKFLLPFLGYFKAKELYKKNNYSIVWSLMASQASIAASLFKKKFFDVKLILTLQEGDEEDYLKRYVGGSTFLFNVLIRPWYLMVFKNADFVAVLSQYLKERAIRNGVKCEIKIIPNGVDLEKFSQKFPDKELVQLKNELCKKGDDKFLVHTGRLNYKNALDDIIKALPLLPDNIKFLSVGNGEEKDNLIKLAQKLGVRERIIFKDFIEHKEMAKYLKVSDIFIRPSLSEGMGSSFLEAMAAEIPVIATPVGGILDFLEGGKTGMFCEVRDSKSIAEAVMVLLKDEKLRNNIIKKAKQMVFEKYHWGLITEDMQQIFKNLSTKSS